MYSARITRDNRTAFVLLCDRSGSMAEEVLFGGAPISKAGAVAKVVNMLLDELVNRCRREEGVRDYFDIAVLEYGGAGVVPLIPAEGGFITPSRLVRMPVESATDHVLRRLPDGRQVASATVRRQWITPRAQGDTPMGAALTEAERLIRAWCARPANRRSFPPVILNITDGETSDCCYRELCDRSEAIKQTGTEDGNVLLMNIHLARQDEPGPAVSFPCHPGELPPHPYARLLWDMSSPMPACYNEVIAEGRRAGEPPFRAMGYNCALDELFSMLAIGSVSGAIMS